jgi:hypothetical protein
MKITNNNHIVIIITNICISKEYRSFILVELFVFKIYYDGRNGYFAGFLFIFY